MAAEYDATLVGRRDVRPGVAFFDIQLDSPLEAGPAGRAFVPGQYVTVGLDAPGGARVRRPMTLTSTPREPQRVELLLNRVETPASEHPLSHLLFDLPIGGRLSVRPVATGTFTLEAGGGPDPARALLIGGGTGVAPFISMLRDRLERGVSLEGIGLLELVGHPEHTIVAHAALDGLVHHQVLGDPCAALEAPDLEARLGLELHPALTPVFACGLGRDLRAVTMSLLSRGYLPRHRRLRKLLDVDSEAPGGLLLEQYDSERLFDVRSADFAAEVKARFQPPPSG